MTPEQHPDAAHLMAQARRGLQADDEGARPARRRSEGHHVRERYAELPGQPGADEHVARRQTPAAQQPVAAAGGAHERAQALVRIADPRRAAPRLRQVADPAGQIDCGDGEGDRDRGGDHQAAGAPHAARPFEQRGQADAAEHPHDCRRGRHEAREAGEAERRHRGDERDPDQCAGGEHARRAAITRAEIRQRPGDRDRQRGGPPERLGGVARPPLRTPGATRAGAEQLGRQPQRGHRERDRDDDGPRAPIGAPRPRRVDDQQKPGLRSHERGQRAQHERSPHTAGQREPDGPERERDEQRLGHPAGGLPRPHRHVVEQQRESERREAGRGETQRAPVPGRQVVRELGGEHERQRPRCAHEDEPQLRCGITGERQRRRDHHGQRLPRRPARRIEAEMGQLASPDEPRPRIVDGLVGDQQRRRSEADAGRNGAEQAKGRHRDVG